MSKDRPPSFQFYPRDFMADPDVQALSWEERGRYLWALCCSALSDTPGRAPEADWMRWMGYEPEAWAAHREAHRRCFKAGPGVWVQRRLSEERADQAARYEQASRGGLARATGATRQNGRFTSQTPADHQPTTSGTTSRPPSPASASASALEEESKDAAGPRDDEPFDTTPLVNGLADTLALERRPPAEAMDRDRVWGMIAELTARPDARKAAIAFAGWLWKTGTHDYAQLDALVAHMVAHRPANPHAYYANTGTTRALIVMQHNAARTTSEHEALKAADARRFPRRPRG